MTPKLEEQIVQQKQQLALLAAIVLAGRESCDATLNEYWEHEVKNCVEIAALIIKVAGQRITGE